MERVNGERAQRSWRAKNENARASYVSHLDWPHVF